MILLQTSFFDMVDDAEILHEKKTWALNIFCPYRISLFESLTKQ